MNKTPNNSIKCSVNSCAYHCGEQNYCTLNDTWNATLSNGVYPQGS